MSKYLLYYNDDKTIKKTKFENVLDDLYFLKCSVPAEENIKDYIKNSKKGSDKIVIYLKSKEPHEIIKEIKEEISKINNKIPLYDEYTKNLLLIVKESVYKKVIYESYRFPDKRLVELLIERKKELEPIVKKEEKLEKKFGEFDELHKSINLIREHRKLGLMLDFLKSFDNEILYDTYVKVFYSFANEVGKNITVCRRPSFFPYYKHIKPYYTRSELINMALNMEKIKPSNKYYDEDEVMKLCSIIKKNDIKADTLIKHQEYIIEQNKIGIIQYYSLQGSYFINQYLRNQAQYEYKNPLLEEIIKSMWELTVNAPEFDKSYILYRFIQDDSYLKHLKIGDTYTDPSFISTTRDPFYRSETYKFGFILIKIKIPADVKGVGLCIEPYSHFPEEEEIILSPLTKLKLEKKDENALYYHTDEIYASNIRTRYEFSYVGKEKISFVDRPILNKEINNDTIIDFIKLPVIDVFTVYEKVKQFVDDYVDNIYQFKTKIGKNTYDLIVEWYDSTNAYKKFYAATTNNGFSIYTIKDNYILFFIELGEEDDITYMYINYYFQFSSSGRRKHINDPDFIDFISKLAFYFRIEKIVLYSEYESCDISEEIKGINSKNVRGGNYCIDYYNYLKNKEKRFKNIDPTEIKPQFSYYELDRMRTIDPNVVLRQEDRDELFQIYKKVYKPHIDESKHNLADFYTWVVENQCVNLNILIDKMIRLYSSNNPFDNDYYIIDPMRYLYNKELISEIPRAKKSKRTRELLGDRVPKNEYRIQYYRKSRVPTKI